MKKHCCENVFEAIGFPPGRGRQAPAHGEKGGGFNKKFKDFALWRCIGNINYSLHNINYSL